MPSRMGSVRRRRFGTLLDKNALGANEQGHEEQTKCIKLHQNDSIRIYLA